MRSQSVVRFAYVTNEMGKGDEFEKVDPAGSRAALGVVEAATVAWESLA